MARVTFNKKPDDAYDRELAGKGLMRTQVLSEVIPTDTGKKDSEGNPIFTFGRVYREKIVEVESKSTNFVMRGKKMEATTATTEVKTEGKAKVKRARRAVTNLSRVVEFVKTSESKSKQELITGIVDMLAVTPANANVYLYKALKEV